MREAHPDHYEVKSAFGDWYKHVPKGYVYAYAERIRDRRILVFKIRDGEYDPNKLLHPAKDSLAPNREENQKVFRGLGYRVEPEDHASGKWVVQYPGGAGPPQSIRSMRRGNL